MFEPNERKPEIILGDPGADSGGKGKSKRAEKNAPFFSARLLFPLPPLSAAGSPRMARVAIR